MNQSTSYTIYFLISETRLSTYVGFCTSLVNRLEMHKNGKVHSTKNFEDFKCHILEHVNHIAEARKREKYWKSAAGRRKLKVIFKKAEIEPNY